MAVKAALLSVVLLSAPFQAAQADFTDWWLTPDQRGRLAFEAGDYGLAAQRYSNPLWKGMAYYANGDFSNAAAYFRTLESAYGYFYLGNALAHLGSLAEAVSAYQQALVLDPDLHAAAFNRDWVAGLLSLSEQKYEDAGGTGGNLKADDFVFSDRAEEARQTMTTEQAAGQGLSDKQIEEIWMRRVQTTPAEFLALKFAYQQQAGNQ